MKRLRSLFVLAVAVLFSTTCAPRQSDNRSGDSQKPGSKDRCPVCGMFVAPHPQWLARVVHEDGSVAFFDGSRDMFRYLADRDRYLPEKKDLTITGAYVTDYYTTESLSAEQAFFVVGSDITGPMGSELIPHRNRSEADEFRRDHGADAVVTFEEVDSALLSSL